MKEWRKLEAGNRWNRRTITFDQVEYLDDSQKVALFFLCGDCGYDLDDGLAKVDGVCLYEGRLLEAATELFEDCYLHEVPQFAQNYIDYEAFANDCRLGGDMCEFEYEGQTYTCTNAAEV